MVDALIVNASPLIFLGNAGKLDLLQCLGATRVIVPRVVFDEVSNSEHRDTVARSIADASWIEVAEPVDVPMTVVEWDLDAGESAVIALGLARRDAKIVLDDLAARRCALALGLEITGTLGVIAAAHVRGRLEDPHRFVLELREKGMWLSDTVVERVARVAGWKR